MSTHYEKSKGTRHPAVWSLVTSLLLIVVTANAPSPLYPLWANQMGFSTGTESAIFACYNLGVLLALFTCAGLVTTMGPRKVLIPALVVALGANLCFMFANTPLWLELGRFLIGLSAGAAIAAATAAIQHNGQLRGMTHPALIASLAVILGFGLGPLLAGITATVLPLPLDLVFGILGVLILIQICVLWAMPVAAVRPLGDTQTAPGFHIQIPALPRAALGTFVFATLGFAGPFAVAALFISIAPTMINQLLGTSVPFVAGFASFLVFGAGAASQFVVRKLEMRRASLLGLALTALGLVCVLLSEHTASLLIFGLAALLSGFGQSITQLASINIVSSTIPLKELAPVNAAFFLGGYAIAGGSVLLLGFASEALGLMGGSEVFAAFCLVIMAVAAIGTALGLARAQRSAVAE